MKTPIARIPITEEVCLYIEQRFYTMEGLKVLLQTFLADTEFPISPEKLTALKEEFLEANTELIVALRQVYKAEVDPVYLDDTYYELEVDFEFNEIQVYAKKICTKGDHANDRRVQQSIVRREADQPESGDQRSAQCGCGS